MGGGALKADLPLRFRTFILSCFTINISIVFQLPEMVHAMTISKSSFFLTHCFVSCQQSQIIVYSIRRFPPCRYGSHYQVGTAHVITGCIYTPPRRDSSHF